MIYFAGKKKDTRDAPSSRRQQEAAGKARNGAKTKFSIAEIYLCFAQIRCFN
jgi:hypothetical protein